MLGLLLSPALASCQQEAVVNYHMTRPAFATAGRETMPLMMLDEAQLGASRFVSVPFPRAYWDEMLECAEEAGYDVTKAGEPPRVLVVPAVRTIRVHDITLDSLLYREDSTFAGERWSPPTVGYSLVRTNAILLTEEYRFNKYLLRHEALHFIAWRAAEILGHPDDLFWPCDKAYDE